MKRGSVVVATSTRYQHILSSTNKGADVVNQARDYIKREGMVVEVSSNNLLS